jgi:hypothetical protein
MKKGVYRLPMGGLSHFENKYQTFLLLECQILSFTIFILAFDGG